VGGLFWVGVAALRDYGLGAADRVRAAALRDCGLGAR